MCHGAIDPKTLMREAEDRYRAVQPAASAEGEAADETIPPQFIPGFRGVVARVRALLPRRAAGATGRGPATIPAE